MIGDFGDRSPRKPLDAKTITPEDWLKLRKAKEAFARQAIQGAGAKLEIMKLLVLVDLQGMYLGLHKWLTEQDFPIDGGLVLSRFAFFQIHDVFEKIRSEVIKKNGNAAMDFEDFMTKLSRPPRGKLEIEPGGTYVHVEPSFELFYAPAPLSDIEWQLKKQAQKGSIEARVQLEQLHTGILSNQHFQRDYSAYDDFVAKLKANPQYSRSEQGFFSYYVGPSGLKIFDEKEVDTRIVIRAMDAFYNYEADVLCIVSPDQDFMPLHEKSSEFGVQVFQADLANFQPSGRASRRLRQLGANFVRGRIDPIWPLQIITEAVSSTELGQVARYSLTEKEFFALCDMHNSMNDFSVRLELLPNGKAQIEISKNS